MNRCVIIFLLQNKRNTRIKLDKYYKTARYYKENIYSIKGDGQIYNKPIFDISSIWDA